MRFVWIRVFVLFLTLLVILPSCSQNDGTNEIIKYDIEEGIQILDPQFATDETARMIIFNSFEGLFQQMPDGSLEPALTESYQVSSDGLTYTFSIEQDTKWVLPGKDQEPVPLTAHDFVFAFQRLFNPNAPSPFADSLGCIKNSEAVMAGTLPVSSLGVEALNDTTLRIVLNRKETMLPSLLASSYAMPCNEAFFNQTMGRYGLSVATMAFNGPFRITRWNNESGISLRRNQFYNGQVIAAGVEFNIPTAIARTAEANFVSDRVQRFLNGVTDACKIDSVLVRSTLDRGGSVTEFEDTVWVLALNTKSAQFSSVEMRQAVAYAVDRSLFTPDLPFHMRATNTLIPPALSLNGHSFRETVGNVSPLAFSPDLAGRSYKKAMEEINRFTFGQILIYDDPDQANLTGYLQRTLQQYISSPVGITRLTPEALRARVKSGDYTAAIFPMIPEYASPDALFNYFRSENPSNFTGFSNQIYDKILSEVSLLSADAQADAYFQAEQLLLTECPVIPLYYETSFFGAAPGVTEIDFAPFTSGIRFMDARKRT